MFLLENFCNNTFVNDIDEDLRGFIDPVRIGAITKTVFYRVIT